MALRGARKPAGGRHAAQVAVPREIAHRSRDGLDVTLVWVRGDREDLGVVCVCDSRAGAYFEIPAEPYLALEVYRHPFAYRDFASVDFEHALLAA